MEKKEITEIKKTLDLRKHCCIERIRTAYVDENKNIVSETNQHLASLGDEEAFRYLDLLKKSLSGGKNKNIYDIPFEEEEERDGGKQERYCALKDTALKDDEAVHRLYESIISNYPEPGKYLIVLGYGIYDVPRKAQDGASLDESEEVYSYVIGSVAPVALLKCGLCFDERQNGFVDRNDIWSVAKPEFGFLFPEFNDRSSDIHSILYYTKNAKDRHEEMVERLFGTALGKSSEQEKTAFSAVVEDTLGRDCSFEKIKEITDTVSQALIDADASGTTAEISKHELKNILANAGASEDGLKKFDSSFEANIGGDSLSAGNLVSKKTSIKSDYIDLSINTDNTDYLESRVIDGREYLLVPVADNIMVNGIVIKAKAGENSGSAAL